MRVFMFSLVGLLCLLQAACGEMAGTPAVEDTFRINGEVTTDTVAAVRAELEKPRETPLRIVISSEGGSSRAFAQLAFLIQRNDVELVIDSFCLSSCAEYLFPATDKLTLSERSIVGFHGNPLLERQLLREAGEEGPFCGEQAGRAIEVLYQSSGADPEFWRRQREVLSPYNVRVIEGPDCKTVEYDREVDTWLPGREELEALLGRRLPNSVCADEPDCVRTRALPLFGSGRVIVAAGVRYPAG
jgi:hypothetical protein